MASSLSEELVQEILVRLPPDEPVHLARACLVCKAWRRVLSNCGCFWRRCHEFHGAPPLFGYIQNRYYDGKPWRFVHMTSSIASPVRMPKVDYSRWFALDSRHGRVLIHANADAKEPSKGLIVWDAITGSQQHLIAPSYHFCNYAGAVLCAKDSCDHLDCHGGPFRVVIVETNRIRPVFAFASIYSSVTGAWSALTSIEVNHRSNRYRIGGNHKHGLVIGDTLYCPFEDGTIVLKYDLCTHWLSQIDMPRDVSNNAILMKAEDGGLGFATLTNNHIYLWSQQDVTNGIGRWVVHRVMELGTLFPSCMPYESYEVVGFAEGPNTIFIDIYSEIFTLDLESKKVRKVGVKRSNRLDAILPYMSFYTSRYSCLVTLFAICTY